MCYWLKHVYSKTIDAWSENMWLTQDNKMVTGQKLTRWVWGFSGSCHPPLAVACKKTRDFKDEDNKWQPSLSAEKNDLQYCIYNVTFLFWLPTIVWLPTNRFVSHSHIPGGPAAEAAGQVIGLLHSCLGWVIRQRSWNIGGPSRQRVHATWAIKTICTPTVMHT